MLRKSVAAAVALVVMAWPAFAQDYTLGSLKIHDPWARATPKGAPVGGGYVSITNTGTTSDRLVGGTTDVSKGFEVHEMSMDKGIMRMRPLPNGLEIKPGQTVTLSPSGYHIMFTGLKAPLTQGGHIDATLKFENAGEVKVQFAIAGIGAMAPDGAQPSGAMGGMKHDMPGMKMDH